MDPEQLKQAQTDLQEIIANLSSGDPAQIKSAQGKLQALGYDVSPDGQLGPKTSAAVGEFRKFVSDTAERGVRSQETQLDLQRTDPTNRALKMGTEALPYAVGAGVGYGTSQGLKKSFDTADKAMGEAADRLATSRRVSPEAAQDQLRKMQRGRTVRTAGQFFAPATFLGAAEATRDYIAPQFEDPGTREAINLLATGEQASGITLGAKQMIDLLRRNNPIDPETEAALRSRVEPNRLLRGQPDAPQAAPAQAPRQSPSKAPSGPPMRHSDRLKQTATAAGAKPGKSKSANVEAIKKNLTAQNMPDVAESLNLPRTANRSTILQRLREISKTGGRYVWPVIAGAVAYDAVTGDAEANSQPEVEAGTGNIADGGVTNTDRLRGAVAGTTAGATVYGGNRLLQALPQSVNTAFGAGAPMLAPQMGADMTDYTPEELNMARNWMARNLPEVMQVGAVGEARDMAQIPERNPARVYENAYAGSGYGQPNVHPVTGRPFLQGDDGGVATEESITVTHPRLNRGQPTNIPSIWGGQRPPYQTGTPEFEDWAVDQALQSGQRFQPYGSIDEAVSAAKQRSDMLGRTMQQPDDFDADIAELQRLLSAMEAEGGQPMPQPQFRVPPPTTGPQNRLLAVR